MKNTFKLYFFFLLLFNNFSLLANDHIDKKYLILLMEYMKSYPGLMEKNYISIQRFLADGHSMKDK